MGARRPTLLVSDPLMIEHDPGPGHPERPARLASLLDNAVANPVPGVDSFTPRPATRAELTRIHDPGYVDAVLALSGRSAQLDEDTAISPRSIDAALLAAGGAVG
ncbi:MAG TPA: histone deacetylase, partial [Polyangia bacterium]